MAGRYECLHLKESLVTKWQIMSNTAMIFWFAYKFAHLTRHRACTTMLKTSCLSQGLPRVFSVWNGMILSSLNSSIWYHADKVDLTRKCVWNSTPQTFRGNVYTIWRVNPKSGLHCSHFSWKEVPMKALFPPKCRSHIIANSIRYAPD